jgi:hypothetical protein
LGQKKNISEKQSNSNLQYVNAAYNYEVSVPREWKIYGEIKNDSIKNFSIIDWGLPKVYSEIEKIEIENSISIRAYLDNTSKSFQSIIANEYLRIDPTTTALEREEGIDENARIVYFDAPNGTKYKGKTYYLLEKGIAYVITFMATPGTYDINLNKFEEMYKNFRIN